MTDRPILFSGPMVQALLAGRKTQTRRIMTPEPEHLQVYDWKGKRLHDSEYRHWCWKGHVGADNWDEITTQLRPWLPYAVGDRLWVKENYRGPHAYEVHGYKPKDWGNKPIWYVADGDPPSEHDTFWSKRMRPSIHMPRRYSRLTLTVTDVRVQRLQDISEADAMAEGVVPPDGGSTPCIEGYRVLWDSLNADRGFGWDANPWVVAVTFTVAKGERA